MTQNTEKDVDPRGKLLFGFGVLFYNGRNSSVFVRLSEALHQELSGMALLFSSSRVIL